MGILKGLAILATEGAWAIERIARERGQLDLKMEIFVAEWGDTVIDASIPINSFRRGYEGRGLFVAYYVREEFDNGATRFNWFHDLDSAAAYARDTKSRKGVMKVVGPYPLPKGKDERFC